MKSATDRHKIYFGAGPAALPEDVLKEASEAVIDYNKTGLSILEIPHRGKLFGAILEESKALVKELCELNDDYEVLWLQGGGRLQFSMVPMNFLNEHAAAGYIDSGHWSQAAIAYANYYGDTEILASSKKENYNRLPEFPKNISSRFSYVHFTTNNTIYGTQWNEIPECNSPLIADMSSDILSKKTAYGNCSLFYAVAQKNIGAAGVTLVVVRKAFLKKIIRKLPPILDYNALVESNSILNTPPVFNIYTSLLMLRWTKNETITVIEKENIKKSELLYEEVERNTLFTPAVSVKAHRSRMNVCFLANNNRFGKGFEDFCNQQNIEGIEGHRSVGGFRVSLYNAVPAASVKNLITVMQEFEHLNSKHKS